MSIAMGLVASACSAALFWLSHHTNRWITSIAKREIAQAALAGGLRNRNELLHAISVAAKELLTATTADMAMATVLETMGKAARGDRMLVFEKQTPPAGAPALWLRYAWHSPQAPMKVDAAAIANAPSILADPLVRASQRRGSASRHSEGDAGRRGQIHFPQLGDPIRYPGSHNRRKLAMGPRWL